MQIKVGFCVAYDWNMLATAIPRVYEHSDMIVLSIDKNRRSWSGIKYDFDEASFNALIKSIDVDNKITIYEDDFSLPNLSSIENDNRQRNLMAKKMGENGWHIQIDSDEYFGDFKGFTQYLKRMNSDPKPSQKAVNVCCNGIILYKKLESGYLYVDGTEKIPFATNRPEYTSARRNGHFNHLSPFFILHETWARDEEQLKKKLQSWGHDTDLINPQSYYNLWQALDKDNYQYIKNFHPLVPEAWASLRYCEGTNIEKIIEQLLQEQTSPSQYYLWYKNSRNIARLNTIWNKIFN